MISRRSRMYYWAGGLLFFSWLSLALLDPDPGRGITETIGLGYFFGSLFAHATLAAAWSAFGPGRVSWRVFLSLIWVISLAIAVGFNVSINGGPGDAAIALGACMLGQWILLQFPLWCLAVWSRLQLRHVDDVEKSSHPGRWQFAIRQLIYVTTGVGMVIGIGRVTVTHVIWTRGDTPIFIFLAATAMVMTLPLLLAALMPRRAIPAVLLVLVLIGAATAFELPLLQSIGPGGRGPNQGHFIAINFFTAAVVLTIISVVRLNGYTWAPLKRGTTEPTSA